jgi:anti-sigma factor RsiW
MTRGIEQDLMRLLHGELPAEEARALRARIFREPELAAAYDRLERTWQGLSLPPASPVPSGFAGRVMAHARSQSASLSWSVAPGWVRATAAAALIAGAMLGLGVGRILPAPEANADLDSEPSATFLTATLDTSLADSYWSLVEDATADGETDTETEAQP